MSISRPRLGLSLLFLSLFAPDPALAQGAKPRTSAGTRPARIAPPKAVTPAPPGTNVRNPPMTQVAQNAQAVPTTVFSIEGAQTVPVRSSAGALRRVKEGDVLAEGDVVFAEDNTYVVLALADGSQVKIGQRTQLEVGKNMGAASNLNLHTGALRGTTSEHLKAPNDDVRAKVRETLKGKHLMFIRTKSAVMGVRGTEFVVSYDSATAVSNFHTLQGTVEIGQSFEGLSSGRLMRVTENRFVRADGNNIYRPKEFNTASYIQGLRKSQPGLVFGNESTSNDDSDLQWKRFRASGLFAMNETGNTISGLVSWSPWYRLSPKFGVGLSGGASMYLDDDGSNTFLVIDGGGFVTYRLFKPWEIEVGGGAQIWQGKDTYMMLAGGLSWLPRKGWLPLVERIVASYRYIDTAVATATYTLGVGISL